jgi:hypothetical protein
LAWNVEGEKGQYLHLWAHTPERAYFVAYHVDEHGSYSPVNPQRIRILDLNRGKWLGS